MSGLLGLLFLGGLFGADFMRDTRKAVDSQYAKKAAELKGEDTYYDGFHNLHWTENNEVLDEITIGGVTEYVGRRSGKVYKTEKATWFSIQEVQRKKLEDGIAYCKEHGIKYFPFHFPNWIGSNYPVCTGIEIETGRKYHCDESHGLCSLIYLEDEPHIYSWGYGRQKEYDAVHDATKEMYRYYLDNIHDDSRQKVRSLFSRDKDAYQHNYYTKEYRITLEEWKERTKEVYDFPFEYYRIKTY